MSSAPVRGTLDILWECLSIFVLCTWSVHHPNVPTQARPQNRKQRFRKQLHLLNRQLRFAVRMLFIPEYEMANAAMQLHSAVCTWKEIKRQDEKWRLADSFFLDMGRYEILFPEEKSAPTSRARIESNSPQNPGQSSRSPPRNSDTSLDNAPTNPRTDDVLELGILASDGLPGSDPSNGPVVSNAGRVRSEESMQPEEVALFPEFDEALQVNKDESCSMGLTGWKFYPKNRGLVQEAFEFLERTEPINPRNTGDKRDRGFRLAVLLGNFWILDGNQSIYAKEADIISSMPKASLDNVEEGNRGGIIVKGLAVFQVVWLIAQISIRSYHGLPSAQLEILALAYAGSALLIYIVLWENPQDIRWTVLKDADRTPTSREISTLAAKGPSHSFSPTRKMPWIPSHALHVCKVPFLIAPRLMLSVYAVVGALVFGGIHVLAWNFTFPTPIERLLWRICSCITAGLPSVTFLILLFKVDLEVRKESHRRLSLLIVMVVLVMDSSAIIYGLARLFIMVEAFRSLCFLPAQAFVSTRTTNVPHIG